MTRAQRIAKNERFRKKYEKIFFSVIKTELNKQTKEFVTDLKNHGIDYAQNKLYTSLPNRRMGDVIMKLYIMAGTDKAVSVTNSIKKEQKGYKQIGDNWSTKIINYFNKFLYSKVTLWIHNTTKAQIRSKIKMMIQNGYGIDWLAYSVENDNMTAWRARMIARTESNRAINYGAQMGAEDSGFEMNKEWVAVHDDRTRESHWQLDGKVVKIDAEFKDNLKFPNDPNGDPEETINCRCHIEYKPIRDRNGRLKPTNKIPELSTTQRDELRRINRIIQSNVNNNIIVNNTVANRTQININ